MNLKLILDDAPLTAKFPTADECMAAYELWIASQQRTDSTVSFSLFMAEKMGELYIYLTTRKPE